MSTDLGMCEHAGRHVEQSGDRLIIIDMGSHMLTGQIGSQNLLQVAVPGLEDRARTFAPLHGVLLMPGGPASNHPFGHMYGKSFIWTQV